MHFIVNRSEWICGGDKTKHGRGMTELKNIRGYKCCIGFVCEQLEQPNILEVCDPVCLRDPVDLVKKYLLKPKKGWWDKEWRNQDWVEDALEANDTNQVESREQRELEVIKAFEKGGHTLEFVGEYNN